ncbi:SSI family serine proteinase inhibitor [Actinosynnema sp. NPDC020468]|uniref:SSI family serine proteinase inhibitor n=1 Tax=Actinosynnema sp. NPDC020468 TaxID=3154488 RepID=UPI0034017CD9
MGVLPLVAALAALVPSTSVPAESGFLLALNRSSTIRVVNLDCSPPGGSHPRAEEACAELALANGSFDQLGTEGVACTMELNPVTVRAIGHWRGETRRFLKTYSNSCVLEAATGTVFKF